MVEPANHAICCFLSGLTDEIQNAVKMFEPSTLHEAYCLAKLQEATLSSIARRTKTILDIPNSFIKVEILYPGLLFLPFHLKPTDILLGQSIFITISG